MCDPVGSKDIARRLGLHEQTVKQWRQRPLGFPEPRWTVSDRPAWEWNDVLRWLKATGRA